jgi:predicted transcriptional regulator
VYYRDEVAGFFDSIKRKDYLAGMPEFMAQLYDVPQHIKRRLRKESITAQKPHFIFFGGGIRDKLYSLLDTELILNGFIPRFLVVGGETDRSRLRPTGPPQKIDVDRRIVVQRKLAELHSMYVGQEEVTLAGQATEVQRVTEVFLTEAAWKRYQAIEIRMQDEAYSSSVSDLALPCFERMSRSLLKMTMLTAALRREPENNSITADVEDVLYAAKFVQEWGHFTVDLVLNSGRSQSERMLDSILEAIRQEPGVQRSKLTQHRHLSKRQMDEIQGTLEDRGLITVKREGKAHVYYAT